LLLYMSYYIILLVRLYHRYEYGRTYSRLL
jgi:hypothetical protein